LIGDWKPALCPFCLILFSNPLSYTHTDYDEIMVVNDGMIREKGVAADLLEIDNGVFKKLVDATGDESSKALTGVALATRAKRNSIKNGGGISANI
jgi:hypothetical protein